MDLLIEKDTCVGLLSWFERGDTLHTVVRQHRRINNLAMDAELK